MPFQIYTPKWASNPSMSSSMGRLTFSGALEKSRDSFPSAAMWFVVVSSHLASSFPGKAHGVRFSAKVAPAVEVLHLPKGEVSISQDHKSYFKELTQCCISCVHCCL